MSETTDAFASAVSLDQLLILDAVDRHGSFTAAARAMRRTQGSVSYHIERLEEQLGLSLFDRSTRTPQLTGEGRRMLSHARRVLAGLRDLRDDARALSTGLEPRLHLAVDALISTSVLASLIREFQHAQPGVELRVSVATPT